ncbi:hypothetical protein KP79_PYT06985 [Mizuhopecten yessoensis]|uniref:Uncharacterized protein n=1 Tax=Mizuhopecten yessoensis TaxID=6573 RepID=A0A210QWX1_MIZYE|nr:hypothetical protein KP79_PYT06985 [Mizuhopecten yessoensis]
MMIHWGGVGIGILLCYFRGVQCTVCSEAAALENIEVIKMCQSGSINTQRVVIDTYDTGDPDVFSCTCTARPNKRLSDIVSFGRSYTVDQEANCGSTLNVQSSQTDSVSFDCKWPDVVYRKKWNSFEFILSRTTRTEPWKYGYCILLDTDAISWNISCLPPIAMTKTSTTTSSSIITRPTSTTRPTTTKPTISSVSVTQTSSSNPPGSSPERNCSPQTVEVFSTATVIVPIVIVVLIAAVATIANVILYRRRLALDSKPKNSHHVLRPSDSAVYDSIDVARLEPPHTYADTTAGRMYANTASDTSAGRLYENTSVGTTAT